MKWRSRQLFGRIRFSSGFALIFFMAGMLVAEMVVIAALLAPEHAVALLGTPPALTDGAD